MEFKVRCMYSEEDCYACERAQRCLIKNKIVYVLFSVWFVVRYAVAILISCFAGWQDRRGYWSYRKGCWSYHYGWRCSSCQVVGQNSSGMPCFFCWEVWRDSLAVVGIGRTGRAIWNNYMNDEIYYTFRETDFLLSHSKGSFRMEYSTIQDIVESHNYFFLFVNTHNAYILPKRDFTWRDCAAFGPFIAEKCGKEIIKIKT